MKQLITLLLLSGCCSTVSAEDIAAIVITDRPIVHRKEAIQPTVSKPASGDDLSLPPIAAAEQQADSPVAGSSKSLRMAWNIEGDWSPSESQTRAHLKSDHGVDTTGMSHQEMLTLHDSLHGSKTVTRSTQSTTVLRSNCPGGVCPTNTSRRRTSRGFIFWK